VDVTLTTCETTPIKPGLGFGEGIFKQLPQAKSESQNSTPQGIILAKVLLPSKAFGVEYFYLYFSQGPKGNRCRNFHGFALDITAKTGTD
jgi:hypothetical protein